LDLPPAALQCLRFLATARRAWSSPADLAAAGHSAEVLDILAEQGLVAHWPEKDAWCLTPLALHRLGLEVDDGRGNREWRPLEVRERWELVEVRGEPGMVPEVEWTRAQMKRGGRPKLRMVPGKPPKPTRAYDRVPHYSQPGAPHPGDQPPGRRGRQETFLPIPSWVPDPHPGPEAVAIAREEAEYVMATSYDADGSEVTAPLEILGVKVRPLRPRKGA
jgi:hypothetical protein